MNEEDLNDSKYRRSLNEERYNEIQKRLGLIRSIYSDIRTAPKSIQEEYYNGDNIAIYLKQGISSSIHGPMGTEDGVVIDSFHKEKYKDAFKKYTEAQIENKNLISKEQEQSYTTPDIDFDDIRSKIDSMNNVQDLIRFESVDMTKYEKYQTLETEAKLGEIRKTIYKKMAEINSREKSAVEESLKVPQTQKWYQKLYQKLSNIFKRESEVALPKGKSIDGGEDTPPPVSSVVSGPHDPKGPCMPELAEQVEEPGHYNYEPKGPEQPKEMQEIDQK